MKEKTDFAGLPAVKVVAVAGLVIVAGLLLFSAPASTTTPQQGAGALNVSFLIDGGAGFTNSREVELSIVVENAEECRYSNDFTTWTDYEAPVETRAWTLEAGDGRKVVSIQCRKGDLLARSLAAITLDSTPPEITIGSPSPETESPFAFSFVVEDEWSGEFSCSAKLDDAVVPLKSNETLFYVQLAASLGEHVLSAECVDEAGNKGTAEKEFEVVESFVRPTPSPSPAVRQVPPYGLEILINGGDYSTESKNVLLGLHAGGADACSYSNDGSQFSAWEPYVELKQWTLIGDPGTKYVYYRCRNGHGYSEVVNDYIELVAPQQINTPPAGLSISINSGAQYSNETNVKLSLTAYNALECRYSNDGSSYSFWEAYVTKRDWTLSGGDGKKYVYYQCRNSYSTSQPVFDNIILDTEPPSDVFDLTAELMWGAAPDEAFVILEWSDSIDETSGVKNYLVYRHDGNQPGEPPELIGTPTTSYFQDKLKGWETGNFWQYTVIPVDNAGNAGNPGNMAEINGQP
ncbi:hypothetical protein COU38_00385 [Candidatus Micrarchaeota archaeon CG10_big_fil_rev_8_21_14_0_10_54_18]|nr:MAG: hypothetical protein COU38_00385 [Candidatus Micrarchaeota archaeon CG10_big_fil_rev_8_21_14_0_10_54_18]